MFGRWGRAMARARTWVTVASVAFLVLSAVWGTGLFGSLSDSGFDDPDAEASRAARASQRVLGEGADLVVLVSSDRYTVEDPEFEDGVEDALARLPEDRVRSVMTFWSTGSEAFVAHDRSATFAGVDLVPVDGSLSASYHQVVEGYTAPEGFAVGFGGNLALNNDINDQVGEDITQAELLSFPVLLVLLLIIFRSVVAALLPLTIGAVAILGAFTVLRVLTHLTEISVYAVNIVTMLGLGLAIDYALFIVTRFREELAAGRSGAEAVAVTMSTAGRTVAVSGLTVAIALSSLLLFPQVFFRSMGLGGVAAVIVAMLASLTTLPALLALLGRRVDAGRLPLLHPRAAGTRKDPARGPWARLAGSVMRRPVLYVAVIVPALLVLGAPFLRVDFGGVDHRALPDGTPSREVAETLIADFPRGNEPVRIVLRGADAQQTAAVTTELEELDGVTEVSTAGHTASTTVLDVRHRYDVYSPEAKELTREVRALDTPAGTSTLVTGTTAFLVDLLDGLAERLPWMALWVGVSTFLLLFLAFGSLLLPLKAIVMNLLSLSASFGALVWIFQDGHLADLLGFTSTGSIEATQPILILAMAFGLSMDYEVFLLSRIREQWDLGADNRTAVAAGLQRTGALITSAALLLVVVIGAFSTSGITIIKMVGIGMLLAIVIDATVVRALLVPATMRLLGRGNWWLPGPLDRLWRRFGIREHEVMTRPGARLDDRVSAGETVG